MSTIHIILIAVASICMIFSIFKLNYKDLSWKMNKKYYTPIVTSVLVILSVLFSTIWK